MQITMFLTLGLLVFPSRLVPIIGPGLLVAACLMLVARPISVFLGLLPSAMNWREKLFTSWVGLRGAAPIILATFPLLAGVSQADLLFNVVFFIVLTSVLLQGASIPLVAKWLRVDAPEAPKRVYPLEYTPVDGMASELLELPIAARSSAAGKTVSALAFPAGFLVVLVARGDDFVLPKGNTVLQSGDTLLVMSDPETFESVRTRLVPPQADGAG